MAITADSSVGCVSAMEMPNALVINTYFYSESHEFFDPGNFLDQETMIFGFSDYDETWKQLFFIFTRKEIL